MSTELVLIAAIAESNRVIGYRGHLPWHLPQDLQRFKRLTLGHSVIMGRRTWESLPKPLPQRHNIIVSTQLPPGERGDPQTQVTVVPTLTAALSVATPRRFIIGGATLYAQTLAMADRLELTFVAGHYEGDAWFPPYQSVVAQHFERTHLERHPGFRYETYRRR